MKFSIPLPEPAKLGIDVTNIGLATAAIIDYLPKATAVVTFVWACLRLYETETVQKIILNIKKRIQSLNE